MTKRTLMQWYRWAKGELAALPVDFPDTEALLLCEHFFDIDGRTALSIHGGEYPADTAAASFEAAVGERRLRPLQYILGEWEFDGMSLAVGEGVLVPREDTLALVELACEALAGVSAPRVLDLCAGSGAVGLAMARRKPDALVLFAELSDSALPYLQRNAEKYGGGRVEIRQLDVLDARSVDALRPDAPFDIILSNPPYIPSPDIAGLSREVRQEPAMALDGGADGLLFYRFIARHWTALLRRGGLLAVEHGIGQEEDIARIFVRENLSDITHKRDFSGISRAIIGTLPR